MGQWLDLLAIPAIAGENVFNEVSSMISALKIHRVNLYNNLSRR